MLSLARGLSVIRAFGSAPLSIAEAGRLTGMSRAAARRCLHTLAVLGYVEGGGGRYRLAPKVLALGYAYLHSDAVPRVAQPVLERAGRAAARVLLADRPRRRRDRLRGARGHAPHPVRGPLRGQPPARLLHVHGPRAAGLLQRSRASAYLARVKPVRHTRHTIVDRDALRAELDRVRAAGYALVDQELEIGLRSLAVPVRRPDRRRDRGHERGRCRRRASTARRW